MFGRISRFRLGKTPRDVDRAIRYLVRDAATHVPFYRSIYTAAGIASRTVRGVDDLPRLPIATKEALLSATDGGWLRRGTDPQRCFKSSTSGTTGMILTAHLSRSEMYYRRMTLVLAIGKNVRLRFPLTIANVGAPPMKATSDLAQRLGFVRIVHISSRVSAADQLEQLRKLRPAILEGRPTLLQQLAEEALRFGELPTLCDVIVTTGEVLHGPVRELLERAFGTAVRDYYSCDEVGNLAWECPDDSSVMHVNSDVCVLEVVDEMGAPIGAGRDGRVLVTSLYNRTMPFIRYEIGDRGWIHPEAVRRCSCGHLGTSMSLLGGRDEDYLVLPDGTRISPRIAFRIVWDQLPILGNENTIHRLVRSFQLVQETPHEFVLRVDPGPHYNARMWDNLQSSLAYLHPGLVVTVRLEKGLELRNGAGKFSAVVSRVQSNGSDPSEGGME